MNPRIKICVPLFFTAKLSLHHHTNKRINQQLVYDNGKYGHRYVRMYKSIRMHIKYKRNYDKAATWSYLFFCLFLCWSFVSSLFDECIFKTLQTKSFRTQCHCISHCWMNVFLKYYKRCHFQWLKISKINF